MSRNEFSPEPQFGIWRGSLFDVYISPEVMLAGLEPRNGIWATDAPELLKEGLSALANQDLSEVVGQWRKDLFPYGVPPRQASVDKVGVHKPSKPDALEALTETDWHGRFAVLMDGEPLPPELREDGDWDGTDDSKATIPVIRVERKMLTTEDKANIIVQLGIEAGAQFMKHHEDERLAREREDWYQNVQRPLARPSLLRVVQALPSVVRHGIWQVMMGNHYSTLEMNQCSYYSKVVRYATTMELCRGFLGDIPPGDPPVTRA